MGKLMFNRILCPVEFDGGSRVAIDIACEVARGPEPIVYLLHVVRAAPALAGVPLEPYLVTRHDVEAELRQMIPPQAAGQVRFELLARKGEAAREILRVAAELGVDSVVIATHGRKGVGRLVLGPARGARLWKLHHPHRDGPMH
jgi:nucleotide-binding universal stress UspA family protein